MKNDFGSVEVNPTPSEEHERQREREESPKEQRKPRPTGLSAKILSWSPVAFLVAYFVFSISVYTIIPETATKIFWFLYLTIGTLLAGVTTIEAYDGLTVLGDARKAVVKSSKIDTKATDDLPQLDIVLDITEDSPASRDLRWTESLRESIIYPKDKLRLTIVCDADAAWSRLPGPAAFGNGGFGGLRVISCGGASASSSVDRLRDLLTRYMEPEVEFVAIFNGGDVPHPMAPRIAISRLQKDAKVAGLQSRKVLARERNSSAIVSSLAALQYDMHYALLSPGRTITWDLKLAEGDAMFWRTASLRAVAEATTESSSSLGLAFTAYAHGVKMAYDLSLIAYTTGHAKTFGSWADISKTWSRAFGNLKLVFTKPASTTAALGESKAGDAKATPRTMKQRFGIFYQLLLLRLGAHSVLQYFSLALAMLFTQAPHSAGAFATTIFFPYPVSIWLIVGGLVGIVATAGMLFKARSEFAPSLWAFPLVVLVFPVMLLGQAMVDVYAQASVLLGSA